MKVGYSFEGLVNRVTAVDESAVHKTGDETIAGLKTFSSCPATTGVQGAANTHLTRRDFVVAELAKKLNLTGGTLTGNLTALAVLVSSAQNTSANALTRKDYVDSAIAAGDALQVSKSGDTMTGALTTQSTTGNWRIAPTAAGSYGSFWHQDSDTLHLMLTDINKQTSSYNSLRPFRVALSTGLVTMENGLLLTAAQGTSAESATRKDYVDDQVASKVSKSGDTMTGNLTISNYAPILALNETDTGKNWFLVADGGGCRFQMDNLGGRNAWEVNSAGTVSIYDPISTTAQGGAAGSLTRKDYVDGQVATRAPMAHTHTVAAITDLKPQDWNATANTLALRDAAADVHARLLRTTYEDELTVRGAIAFRGNNSTDNYTRYCSDPAAVRNWMQGAKTEWLMSWRAYIEDPSVPMTEYHIPGTAAVITYLATDGNYRISTSNGNGGATADRLRLDSGGNLFTTAAIHEAGHRVYSPNNQPHYSHNHTAEQGNADIVANGWGQVGSYAMACCIANVGAQTAGFVIAGSNLKLACGSDQWAGRGATMHGTWKLLGYIVGDGREGGWNNSTWIRIA